MFANRVIGGMKIPCVALYIVVVLVIVLYGHFLRKTKTRDILAKRIYHHPVCQEIDGWSVSHLIFFGLLGFLYPGNHLQFLAIGIAWEVVETGLGQNNLEISGKRLQLIGDQDEDGNSVEKPDAYWYGKESDIIMDIVGYCVGSALADRYWPNPAKRAGPPQQAIGYPAGSWQPAPSLGANHGR